MANDHPIRIERNASRVRVRLGDAVIADSRGAFTLFEATYPGVIYVPREDVDMRLLARTTHRTHCPYKGDASYYSINAAGRSAENAVWSYENPIAGVSEIASRLAFYPNRVEIVRG